MCHTSRQPIPINGGLLEITPQAKEFIILIVDVLDIAGEIFQAFIAELPEQLLFNPLSSCQLP